MSKIHFVTFGCDENFKLFKNRIAREVAYTGWFDKIFVYEPSMLQKYNKKFAGRGAGYWWWKPIVQWLAMSQMNDGDLLIYLDAGVYKTILN